MSEGIKVDRLLVVVLILLSPFYFFALIWAVKFSPVGLDLNRIVNFNYFFAPFGFNFSAFFTVFIAPILLTVPWILLIFIYKTKMSNSFIVMKEDVSFIPTRWRIFYAVNGFIVIFTFLIPIISPALVLLFIGEIAWAIIRASDFAWDRSKIFLVLYSLLIFVILMVIPIIFFMEFMISLPNFFFIILEIWIRYVPYFYDLTIIIANALSIGSIFWLIYAGAVEYERQELKGMSFTEVPTRKIRILEYLLFFIFLIIWIPIAVDNLLIQSFAPLVPIAFGLDLIFSGYTTFALIAGVLVMFIAFIKGLHKRENRAPILGYLFGVIFVLMEVVRMAIEYIPGLVILFGFTINAIQGGLIIFAGIVFLIIFLVSLIRAEGESDDY